MGVEEPAVRLELEKLSPALGAEIIGVDLGAPMPDALFASIWRAFLDHKLLLFRGQRLSPQRHVDFARRFGPVDVHVNNAGITRDGTLMKMDKQAWNEVIDTNLGGCFTMAKAVFPGMKERGWGRIVNIGSINGQAGQYGQVNYAAAKSGIHGFTKALAQEGARFGITVNAIAPGYIDTDMVAAVPPDVLAKIVAKIPVGRLGQAQEIARGVAFLVAEDAGFVTGSTLSINGGQHMY